MQQQKSLDPDLMNLGSKKLLHTLGEEPGFASLSVDVSMGPEEGLESCSLGKQGSISTSSVIRSMILFFQSSIIKVKASQL